MERPTSEDDEPKLEKRVPTIDQVSPTSPSASVDHEPAPPLAGLGKKKKEEIVREPMIRSGYKRSALSGRVEKTSRHKRSRKKSASEALVNQRIYSSFKSQLDTGSKGTKGQSSSACSQVPLTTENKGHEKKKKEEIVREPTSGEDEPKLEKRVPLIDQVSPTSPSPSVDHEPAPPLTGHEKKKEEEILRELLMYSRNSALGNIFYHSSLLDYASEGLPTYAVEGSSLRTYDCEALVNEGIYSSVKSQLASGSKGTKGQGSSACGQVPLTTENNKR